MTSFAMGSLVGPESLCIIGLDSLHDMHVPSVAAPGSICATISVCQAQWWNYRVLMHSCSRLALVKEVLHVALPHLGGNVDIHDLFGGA